VYWSDVKYQLFSQQIKKLFKRQISWKSLQLEPSCFMPTDGRTDTHDATISRFSQFCECVQ